MNLVVWCNRLIGIGFALLFALVPLLLTPWNYELFEYNKMMAVYAITVMVMTAWMVKMVTQREVYVTRTPLDLPIALFLSSQFLSTLFSMDPHVSWFGYYSRFNGGMWSIISYILLFYAFVSNYKNYNDYKNYIKLALASGTVVALYGVLERLGIDKHLWVQDVQNRVFSTLGQPNWLAAYLVALSPLALAFSILSLRAPIRQLAERGAAISVLFFAVVLFTRSRSGLLGFAAADAAFWLLVFIRPPLALQGVALQKLLWRPFLIIHAIFVIVVFLNGTHIDAIDRWVTFESWKNRFQQQTTNNKQQTTVAQIQGTLLEYGGTESGKIRNFVWQGAINAWRSSTKAMLIGTGTETFAFAFFRNKPVGHNLTSEWDFLYNKAHNEYLNYLATTGVFGLGSYLLFIGSFILWFFKFSIFNYKFSIINFALFAGWVSVLVTNFFGFSVVLTNLFLFLFPAMMFVISDKRQAISKKITLPFFSILLVLLVLLALLVLLVRLWVADVQFATAYRLSRAGDYAHAQTYFDRAISLNNGEPLYHDEAAANLAGLGPNFTKQALAESDKALSTSPKNVNFWKTRTKIFYAFSEFDKEFNKAAIQSLEKAAQLAPTDPKIFYNLAILYGREGSNEKSIDTLKKTIDLKPNYRDAYYALWVFFTETKQPEKARETLQSYLEKVDPNDKDFQERIKL